MKIFDKDSSLHKWERKFFHISEKTEKRIGVTLCVIGALLPIIAYVRYLILKN